uniref:ATP-dependent DNA helicase n=1 Tax=Rhabditophanes sp. KR3021 TaxID=114890 RepID=A0AC35TKX4_9BILA
MDNNDGHQALPNADAPGTNINTRHGLNPVSPIDANASGKNDLPSVDHMISILRHSLESNIAALNKPQESSTDLHYARFVDAPRITAVMDYINRRQAEFQQQQLMDVLRGQNNVGGFSQAHEYVAEIPHAEENVVEVPTWLQTYRISIEDPKFERLAPPNNHYRFGIPIPLKAICGYRTIDQIEEDLKRLGCQSISLVKRKLSTERFLTKIRKKFALNGLGIYAANYVSTEPALLARAILTLLSGRPSLPYPDSRNAQNSNIRVNREQCFRAQSRVRDAEVQSSDAIFKEPWQVEVRQIMRLHVIKKLALACIRASSLNNLDCLHEIAVRHVRFGLDLEMELFSGMASKEEYYDAVNTRLSELDKVGEAEEVTPYVVGLFRQLSAIFPST